MKTCRECGDQKAEEKFYLHPNRGKLRRVARCKDCYGRKTKLWRAKHKTKERAAMWAANVKVAKARIKDAVFGAYGGYVCRCCGETEKSFLTIDHIMNDGATWRKMNLGTRLATGWQTYRWLHRHNYPGGFQVLCMNCNFGKRMNGGSCPHSVRRNDYPQAGVEPSGSKRLALGLVPGDDIVSSARKRAAVQLKFR